MMVEVRVGAMLAARITDEYGPARSAGGQPSEWDFWSGPLAAALIGFRSFEGLSFDTHPDVRTLHVIDPVFGPVVFVGVLIAPELVEVADFAVDPDYWDVIEEDPND